MAQMVKNLPAIPGELCLIPGLGRSPGEGNGYSLQYSCLENPMDRGAWWATVHGVSRQVSDTTKQLMHKDHISLGGGDVAQSFISVGDQSSLLASFGREPKFWPVGCKQK